MNRVCTNKWKAVSSFAKQLDEPTLRARRGARGARGDGAQNYNDSFDKEVPSWRSIKLNKNPNLGQSISALLLSLTCKLPRNGFELSTQNAKHCVHCLTMFIKGKVCKQLASELTCTFTSTLLPLHNDITVTRFSGANCSVGPQMLDGSADCSVDSQMLDGSANCSVDSQMSDGSADCSSRSEITRTEMCHWNVRSHPHPAPGAPPNSNSSEKAAKQMPEV